MKRHRVSLFVGFVFAVAGSTWLGVQAQQAPEPSMTEQPASLSDSSDLWFVELSSPPTVDGTSLATTRGEKAAFRGAAARAGLAYQERYVMRSTRSGTACQSGSRRAMSRSWRASRA